MKQPIIITTIAAVLLTGCATQAKQLSPVAESKLDEPVAEVPAQSLKPLSEAGKALIDAALTGNIEAAKQAIVDDANMNVKGSGRWTPMHFAAWGGYNEVVKLLIAKDADLNAEDVNGKTPLDWAIEKNHPEIADLLRKHGGKTGEELKAEGK
ncbi:MAG: ankyrin repeat domain-containing protein [Verrucomicrobiota bacterium]|nr:ankyrin repeat domain-containing protein [Verrucomicrobiota bacterium]